MGEKKVMIIGLGHLGTYALEFLVRTPGIDSIFTAGINREEGLSRTTIAILGAAQMGFYPHVEFFPLDLNNIDEVTSILKRVSPDVILSCVTLQSWWVILEMPSDIYKKLEVVAGLGPWLPMQVTLNYKLMQAVKRAGIKTHVIVASFPDAVCPILGKVGLAPTIGLGNIDNFIPEIRKIVGEKMGIPMRNISVYLIASHALRSTMKLGMKSIPYFLKIFAEGKDVTERFDLDQLLFNAVNLMGRWQSDSKVASSGVKNALAILNNTGEITHSPGPHGLPGGYPVRLSSKGAEVVLPEGIGMEEAIRINEGGQKYDGIEKIEDDGTVICTEEAVKLMKELFGYDCRRIGVGEMEEKAKELSSLYREYVKKFR